MRIKKTALVVLLVYLALWALTASVGKWQIDRFADKKLEEYRLEHNIQEIVRLDGPEEQFDFQQENRDKLGYYYISYSPTPFWIRIESRLARAMKDEIDVFWLFGYTNGLPK